MLTTSFGLTGPSSGQ